MMIITIHEEEEKNHFYFEKVYMYTIIQVVTTFIDIQICQCPCYQYIYKEK